MTDLDELLGDVQGPSESREVEPRDPDIDPYLDAPELPDASVFHRPVGITFIAKVLGKETRRLHKQLAHCPIVGYGTVGRGKGAPLYDFREAIKYCVPPKMDLGVYIRSLGSAGDLPPHISKQFWDGQNAKLRYEERSRHTWRDEDVLEVLGRTALEIKEATQLWIENLPGKATMTTAQHQAMLVNVAELLDSIHQRLVTLPSQRRTLALVASMEDGLVDSDDEAGE